MGCRVDLGSVDAATKKLEQSIRLFRGSLVIPLIVLLIGIAVISNNPAESSKEVGISFSFVCDVLDQQEHFISERVGVLIATLKNCNDKGPELVISLMSHNSDTGWTLIKNPVSDSPLPTSLSDLGFRFEKMSAREYELHIPAGIDISNYAKIDATNGAPSLDVRGITFYI